MATSGSIDFSVSRDNLIDLAHQHIGALGEGETCTSNQYTEGAKLLNMICKARQADGMPLWALKKGYILPFTGASSIALGSTVQAVLSYVTTTTTAAAAAGASTIVVTSATGISTAYNIGVWCTDNTIQWTTVNGAPSGTTVTLAATLTVGCASGARVFVYQTANRIGRPLRIIQTNVYNVSSGVSRPLRVMAMQDYNNLPNRTTASSPNSYAFDPQLTTGDYYIYPRMATTDEILEIVFHRTFEDFDATGDTPDFPQEWYLALMTELAAILGPKFGVPPEERKALREEAEYYHQLALSTGTPEESIFLHPEQV